MDPAFAAVTRIQLSVDFGVDKVRRAAAFEGREEILRRQYGHGEACLCRTAPHMRRQNDVWHAQKRGMDLRFVLEHV